MDTRHFLLTNDGNIRVYSNEEAQRIALGLNRLPEFADSWVRYLQVQIDETQTGDAVKIATAAASIHFDNDGRLHKAGAPAEHGQKVTEFEHETCVQLALSGLDARPAIH
ncbi:MAG: hypothetical protein ACRETN_10275 [Nevskiales bacterium]